MGKSLNRYIPFCSANQLITYLTLQGLSDAQIRLISGREDWKICQHTYWTRSNRRIGGAVRSVSI
jgi:hypothetical protein